MYPSLGAPGRNLYPRLPALPSKYASILPDLTRDLLADLSLARYLAYLRLLSSRSRSSPSVSTEYLSSTLPLAVAPVVLDDIDDFLSALSRLSASAALLKASRSDLVARTARHRESTNLADGVLSPDSQMLTACCVTPTLRATSRWVLPDLLLRVLIMYGSLGNDSLLEGGVLSAAPAIVAPSMRTDAGFMWSTDDLFIWLSSSNG